jgi:hypothetical protein
VEVKEKNVSEYPVFIMYPAAAPKKNRVKD